GQPAGIGDVVPDQWDTVVTAEHQCALELLEQSASGVILRERGEARLAEQVACHVRTRGEEAADTNRQWWLVGQYPGVRGAVQRRRTMARISAAHSLTHERAPLLAEHLPGQYELDPVVRPRHPARQTVIDHVLEERRVAKQHNLFKMLAQRRDDT